MQLCSNRYVENHLFRRDLTIIFLYYNQLGTDEGMKSTFGSTCHGAGRALSRAKSRRNLDWHEVLQELQDKGISMRVASPKLVMEEVISFIRKNNANIILFICFLNCKKGA